MKLDLTKEQALAMTQSKLGLVHRDNWELEQIYRLTGSKLAKKILDQRCPGWLTPEK
jgi:hypothetical protein